MKSRRYEAQALAIAMVVLVISSILGMSIYSRVSTDRTLAIKEQASAEALEVADLLLGYITEVPIEDILSQISMDNFNTTGSVYTENDQTTEITTLLGELGLTAFSRSDIGFCSVEDSGNTYTLTFSSADENDFFEIRPGNVRSFLLTDITEDLSSCSADFNFDLRGETNAGFSVSKIYRSSSDEIKEYDFEDVESYCFSDDNVTCNNTNFEGQGWNMYQIGDALNIAFSDSSHAGYELDEVRIKGIGSTIGMSYSLNSNCPQEGLRLVSIQAEATCSGVYRAKELLVPENQWSLPIFDYVIFNGEGAI